MVTFFFFFRHTGDNFGAEEELSSESAAARFDTMMTAHIEARNKHKDASAAHINVDTGERCRSGLRIAGGFSEAPLLQTISSSAHMENEGDLQNETTIGWRVRMLVCLSVIFYSFFFFVNTHKYYLSYFFLQFPTLRLMDLCGDTLHNACSNFLSRFFLVFSFDDHEWTDRQMEALENAMIEYMNFLNDLFTGVVDFSHSPPPGMKSTFKFQKKSKKKEGSEDDDELFYRDGSYYFAGFVAENVRLTDGRVSTRHGVNNGGDLIKL